MHDGLLHRQSTERYRRKRWVLRYSLLLCSAAVAQAATAQALPDAPSAVLLAEERSDASPQGISEVTTKTTTPAQTPNANQTAPASLPDCPTSALVGTVLFLPKNNTARCQKQDPLQFIVEPGNVKPLTSKQKGILALRGDLDPFGLITLVGFSGISIASNSHSPYGPGLKGWGTLVGYGMVENATGNFFGTYAIPSLTHEDPRYHRMPGRPLGQRIAHSIIHTYVSQHDDGRLMPNYGTLLDYPISSEIASLYVPGSTTAFGPQMQNVAFGILTNPVGDIIAEFLPDVARRIHVHIIFVQSIINRVAGPSNNSLGG
jgi:hypothetical protein